jgi:Histone methylation protein DOT1
MHLHTGLQQEILSDIETIANDEMIFRDKNFIIRSQAMDDLEFRVIDRLKSLAESGDLFDRLIDLRQKAEQVRRQLEEVNTKMFDRLRPKISGQHYRGKKLMNLINEYLDQTMDSVILPYKAGYDNLDLFINGLLTDRDLPAEIKEREPGMIYYQKTPARIILELVKKADFQPGDVFYDLGSGLGQATILVNLLATVISKGVEFEPAYCNYAKACAADLNLSDVNFINEDARHADYSSGNIFFMYTPFEGDILKHVLQNLYGEAKKRKIKIFTYGSCTTEVVRQHWLRQVNEIQNCMLELAKFVSV